MGVCPHPCGAGCVALTKIFLLKAKLGHNCAAAAETPDSLPTPPTVLAPKILRDELRKYA